MTLSSLDGFRALAVPGSRWQCTHPGGDVAECTVTEAPELVEGENGLPLLRLVCRQVFWEGARWAPQPHAVREASAHIDPARVEFAGGRMLERTPTRRAMTWTYLGPPRGPVDRGTAVDRSAVVPVPVEQLQPGDVVYGPWVTWERDWSGPQLGFTVDHVDASRALVVVTTREGWPLWLGAGTPVAAEPVTARPAPAAPATVYLTINTVSWLWRDEFAGVPLCISRNRLAGYRGTLRPARASMLLLDSGGFTELKIHGRWRLTPAEYLAQVRTHLAHIAPGRPVAVVQQDMMCEPQVIYGGQTKDGTFVGTRQFIDPDRRMDFDELVYEHQRRSTANLLELRRLAPDLHIVPVLQGYTRLQYARHAGMLEAAGIRLADEPVVGLGSVCRRQGTAEIAEVVRYFAAQGIRLHGFGVGVEGLSLYGDRIGSTDSNAWSYNGRHAVGRCPHGLVRWEANCPRKALDWLAGARRRLAAAPTAVARPLRVVLAVPQQLDLLDLITAGRAGTRPDLLV